MSNLSTYFAGALVAVLVMDHSPTVGGLLPSFELFGLPGEVAEPAINRLLKGDRWAPAPLQRDSRPANAPLEVVDLPTGSTGVRSDARRPAPPMNNVSAIARREPPVPEPPPGKRVLPMGCESAFGRLAAPPLAQVLGRCII